MAAATNFDHQADTGNAVTKIRLAGEVFDGKRLRDSTEVAAFQRAMQTARTRFGHALCDCRRHALKLQIRLRDGRYHLAVWPEEGHLHDSSCIFFRDEDDFRHRSALTRHASAEQTSNEATGPATEQSIPLQSLDRPGRATNPAQQQRQGTDGTMPLQHLLSLLWTEASLCRWHPTWKRDWGRTRYQLIEAAAGIDFNGAPLSDRFYAPRPYRDSLREAINNEFDRFVGNLARSTDDAQKNGIIVAPVRQFVELPSGQTNVLLRHMNTPVGLSEQVYDFLLRTCRNAMRRVDANHGAREILGEGQDSQMKMRHPEVVAILLVRPSTRLGLWAKAAWLMQVHPQRFIPANNQDEVALVNALTDQGYQFSRLLNDAEQKKERPEWVVRHVADPLGKTVPRVAMEIMNNGASPEYLGARGDLVDRLAKEGVPTWTWTPVGSRLAQAVPPLPPHEQENASKTEALLVEIARNHLVHYAYGSGR